MTDHAAPSSLALLRAAGAGALGLARQAWMQGLVVSIPLAIALSWTSVLAAQVYRAQSKPFDLYILSLIVLVFAAIPAQGALLRRALRGETGPVFGLRLGGDEKRLAIVALLLGILAFTVLGAAGLGLVAVIAGLDLAARAGADAPPIDSDAADAVMPMLGEYFGQAEWIAAAIAVAVFAIFAIWFLARLSLAYPATVAHGKVQALSSFALSRGRWIAVALALLPAWLAGWIVRTSGEFLTGAVFGLPLAVEGLVGVDGMIAGPAIPTLAALFLVSWLASAVTLVLVSGASAGLYSALTRDPGGQVPV